MNRRLSRFVATGLFVLAVLAVPLAAHAQLPSSPRRFVDFLDERCYQIPGQPALGIPLVLSHLNPVFVSKGLPDEEVTLGVPQKLCVPVSKNGSVAPADTLPFIRFVDWKCYAISGPSLNLQLQLTQLNPVIAGLFGGATSVTVREPQQLCVPVVKNTANPPANVLQLVQWLDVKCYRVDSPAGVSKVVTLQHLNPLFSTLPPETSTVGPQPTQLCVPVAKNHSTPPTSILPFIQFSDVLCYPATGAPLGQNLSLKHINPVLVSKMAPVENVFIGNSLQLCVPVAKNGMLPPGAP